ncbi:hypothetical protein [Streptomyces cupreus]|uniref:Uncharacterized protein n=1 Tax=Streptomyces cupreus TaxID=2759956 RepID=A0A7X1MAI2_9ACTN|nr:hypothetical protein [Streptomyces cupreus]MBC2904329.1 hypothetical protein [Streptomyces cupreus]
MTSDGERSRITVDGEEFEVVQPYDSPGTYHISWVTGPDPQYGFGFRVHPPVRVGRGELEEAVRDFLTQVDPATGHIE